METFPITVASAFVINKMPRVDSHEQNAAPASVLCIYMTYVSKTFLARIFCFFKSQASFVAILLAVLGGLRTGSATRIDAEGPLTRDSAIAYGLQHNRDLAAARFLIEEARSKARGAGRLTNPEFEGEVAGGRTFEGRIMAGISQKFPLTGRLRLERQLSGFHVQLAEWEVAEQERQMAIAIGRSFYELAATREVISILNKQADFAESFRTLVAEGTRSGMRSQLDEQEASLAISKIQLDIEAEQASEIELVARLCQWLGLPADSTLSLQENLNLPRSAPAVRSIRNRPDLELAGLAIRAGESSIALSKAKRWEDIGIGVFVEGERFRDDPNGIQPETLAGLKMSIPLPVWQNGSQQIAESEASRARADSKRESLRFTVQNEVILAHRLMSQRFRSASDFSRKFLTIARDHVRDCESAHARGELDPQAAMRARERLTEIEISDLEARKAYFLAYNEWLGALGETTTNP